MIKACSLLLLALFAQQASVESALRQAVSKNPASFEANHKLGEFLLQQGRLREAIPFLEQAHRADRNHAVNGYDLGLAYLKAGDTEKARNHVRDLLASGERSDLQNLLGSIEAQAGNPIAAAKAFYRAAEIEPSEKNLFDLGDHLLRHGGYADARELFLFAIAKHPNSARLRIGLGIALYELRDYDEAVRSLCDAVDLDPGDSRALYFLGKMHDVSPAMAGQVAKRLAGFVERRPDDPKANFFYALSLWRRHESADQKADLQNVERFLKKAAALDPQFAEAQLQLGILYEDTGRASLAMQAYRRALDIDPDLDKAHYRLGQLYNRARQPEMAQKHLAAWRRLRQKKQGGGAGAGEGPP